MWQHSESLVSLLPRPAPVRTPWLKPNQKAASSAANAAELPRQPPPETEEGKGRSGLEQQTDTEAKKRLAEVWHWSKSVSANVANS